MQSQGWGRATTCCLDVSVTGASLVGRDAQGADPGSALCLGPSTTLSPPCDFRSQTLLPAHPWPHLIHPTKHTLPAGVPNWSSWRPWGQGQDHQVVRAQGWGPGHSHDLLPNLVIYHLGYFDEPLLEGGEGGSEGADPLCNSSLKHPK